MAKTTWWQSHIREAPLDAVPGGGGRHTGPARRTYMSTHILYYISLSLYIYIYIYYTHGAFYFVCVMKFHSEVLILLNGTIFGVTVVSPPNNSSTQIVAFLCLPWSQTE